MDRPVKKTPIKPCWDYHEVIDYLETKHLFNSRDYANHHHQFNEWCESKGYVYENYSNRYGEYIKEIEEGIITERPYLDFWQYIINIYDDISNGCTLCVNIEECMEDAPEFVKTILDYMVEEGFTDNGDFECWISW